MAPLAVCCAGAPGHALLVDSSSLPGALGRLAASEAALASWSPLRRLRSGFRAQGALFRPGWDPGADACLVLALAASGRPSRLVLPPSAVSALPALAAARLLAAPSASSDSLALLSLCGTMLVSSERAFLAHPSGEAWMCLRPAAFTLTSARFDAEERLEELLSSLGGTPEHRALLWVAARSFCLLAPLREDPGPPARAERFSLLLSRLAGLESSEWEVFERLAGDVPVSELSVDLVLRLTGLAELALLSPGSEP